MSLNEVGLYHNRIILGYFRIPGVEDSILRLRGILIIHISSFHTANRSNALFKSTSDASSVVHRLFITTSSPDIIVPCKPLACCVYQSQI